MSYTAVAVAIPGKVGYTLNTFLVEGNSGHVLEATNSGARCGAWAIQGHPSGFPTDM